MTESAFQTTYFGSSIVWPSQIVYEDLEILELSSFIRGYTMFTRIFVSSKRRAIAGKAGDKQFS